MGICREITTDWKKPPMTFTAKVDETGVMRIISAEKVIEPMKCRYPHLYR